MQTVSGWSVRKWVGAAMLVGAMLPAAAQTLATGDTRTVNEPTFPVACSTLMSQMAIVSGAPASETATDTSRIQAALTACPSGQAVELAPSGTNFAFLTAPINIPNGVSLIVDGGVTVFATRNREDYQVGTISTGIDECGTQGTNGNGCKNWIAFANGGTNVGSGVYGYGVLDARGYATTFKAGADTGISWWKNADVIPSGYSQNNPIIMKLSKSTNFILYKITIKNSPEFHVGWSGNGFTAWGVKIITPFTPHNTDGIDPSGTNVTITNSSISDGDDDIAVGASSASSNITVSNVTTYSGHGISVGSYTQGGLNNFLVKNSNMAGTATDGNATGIRLKSAPDRGGLVQNVTYQNMCLRDMRHILQFTPFYNTNSGTLIPAFSNIVLQNIHFLAPTTTQNPYLVQLQGYDSAHVSTITLNNVVFDSLSATNVTPASQNDAFTLAGNVYPAFLQSLPGTNVSYTGAATSTAGAGVSACTNVFPYIVGELYLSTAAATNLQTASVAGGKTVTLNAMLQPAMSQVSFSGSTGSWIGVAAPSQPISFFEGTTLVGTGTLGVTGTNGTLASLTLSNVPTGSHTYTAQYPGDTNYAALTFGSVIVTVTSGTATALETLTAPATTAYGTTSSFSVLVTGSSATPTGSVTFYDGTSSLGTVALVNGAASVTAKLTGGAHTATVSYSGDPVYAPSTSTASSITVSAAATTAKVSANPTTVLQNLTTTLTATITGVSGYAIPTGTVDFADNGTYLGTGTLGSTGVATFIATSPTIGARTITAAYSGDGNYNVSSATTTVTVSVSTITTLTAPASAVYGAVTSISAAVTYPTGTPTGTVTFYDAATLLGTGTLTNGVATLANVKLLGGNHDLSAVYGGATGYPASTSAVVSFVVTTANPTVAVMANPTSVSAGGTATLTATILGVTGGAVATGNVDFLDGTTDLGTVAVSASGVATLTGATLNTFGTRTITAVYSGDTNYSAVNGTGSIAVNSVATTTTLTVSPSPTYTGATVTLAATVTPAAAGGTVTFLSNGTVLGTAPVNTATGVATYQLTAGSAGTYSETAAYAANGNYAASAGAVTTLTVVAAVSVSVNPNQISMAPGSSTSVSISVAAGGGFTGAVTLGCSSPVSYVMCTVASTTTTLTGASSQAVAGTITVAATTGQLRQQETNSTLYAWLLPAGLLALAGATRKRKLLQGVCLLAGVGLVGVLGLSGCAGSSSSNAGNASNKPTGSQTVSFTATANGVKQTTTVQVNFTN